MSRLLKDDQGFPMLVDDLARPDATTVGELLPQPDRVRPSADEVARRRDAVREAAREMEPLSAQDLRERLKGVTTRPLASDEIAAFTSDVHSQVKDDMVDVLDQATRGRLRSRRTLRLSSPRGYVKRTLHAMSDDDLVEVAGRLRARGWDDDMVAHGLAGRLTDKRLDGLASKL